MTARRAQWGSVSNILRREEQDHERENKRDGMTDFYIQPVEKKRNFIFYDAADLKAALSNDERGIIMYPYAKVGKDKFGPSRFAGDRATYDKLYALGYRPKVTSNNHKGSIQIPENLYRQNKVKFNEIFRDLIWNYRHPQSLVQLDSDQKIMSMFRGANIRNVGPLVQVKPGGDLVWNSKISGEAKYWTQGVAEYYREFSDRQAFLNPFDKSDIERSPEERESVAIYSEHLSEEKDRDEGNVQESENYECPEELVFGSCSNRNSCPRQHGLNHHTDHDETVHYPVKTVVDQKCSYPIMLKGVNGNVKVGIATRIPTGGFITVKHVFYDGTGLREPLSNYFLLGHDNTDQHPIVGMLSDVVFGKDDKVMSYFKNCRMDYCRIRSTREFEIETLTHAISPNVFRKELASDLRMLKYDVGKGQNSLDQGRMREVYRNNVSYGGINTAPGDSGSPVFDQNGRFVAMHEQGGERSNIGITFSVDGYVPSWFVSALPDLNYQSPCIQ